MPEVLNKALTPPLQCAMVLPQVYRGSYPRPINYRYLKRLRLRTIISLTPDAITPESDAQLYNFAAQNNINLIHIKAGPEGGKGKKRGVSLTYEAVTTVIKLILDSDTGPVFVHCLNGCQVTSLTIACLRRISMWSLVSIFSEFIAYSPVVNAGDRAFVEQYFAEFELNDKSPSWVFSGLSTTGAGVIIDGNKIRVHSIESSNKKLELQDDDD